MVERGEVDVPEEGVLARVQRFVMRDLWHLDLRPRSLTAAALRLLQLGVMIAQGFIRDQLLLRASGLAYVSTLSLIPLLIVMVAFAGMVGGQQALVDMVVDQLTAVSPDARDVILERVRGVKLGSLGTIGATLLVATAVLALRHLEATLNEIWGIRVNRSWMRRFSDYLTVLVVAPILAATAISLSATLQSEPLLERLLEIDLFASLYDAGLSQLPTVLLIFVFTFLYWFFPNTSVRVGSALLGGIVATILFSLARYVYVDFSIGAARYSVLFGGMVALPLILVWLYVCWAVVLLGAEVAFAHQNLSHYRRELRGQAVGAAEREALGLRVAVEVARAFAAHDPPPHADMISEELDIPVRSVRELLESYVWAGMLVVCGLEGREGGYVPARPLADISVADVMQSLRGERHGSAPPVVASDSVQAAQVAVDRVLTDLDRSIYALTADCTLADLLGEPSRA
jgi:membrane protein